MTTPNPAPRVLVVDDDVDTCHNLRDILTDLGYTVEIAHDGPSALQMIRQRPFDVALLDLKMPGMDGLTLYREIKRVRSGTVAIIVTAYATGDTAALALRAGAWRVLSKPVDLGQLMPLVEEAAHQPLIMIIDDDHDLCETLWDILRDRGFRVCLAHNEQEVLERLPGTQHRVVLIDMKLPDGDGSRVFHLVRQANPQARVVLITGFRTELQDLLQRVVAEGADGVCYKPFDMPQLLETVEKLTSGE